MKYRHVVEERKYKYGPQEQFKTKEELINFIRAKRGEVLTKLSLEGYWKAVKVIEEQVADDTIKLSFLITYPICLLED